MSTTSMQCVKIDSLVRRSQIVTLHGQVYKERDATAKLRCSKTAVHNAIVIFHAGGIQVFVPLVVYIFVVFL